MARGLQVSMMNDESIVGHLKHVRQPSARRDAATNAVGRFTSSFSNFDKSVFTQFFMSHLIFGSMLSKRMKGLWICLQTVSRKGSENTWFAIDNIDPWKTRRAKETFHGTVVVMFQQDKDGEFMNRPLNYQKSLLHKSLALDWNMVPEPVIKPLH
ncbi:hypothetical protein GWK47_038026 [Chionoecetes opilio]|uniref:Uncharacterized protein n=1 Tax=Chionoecetes opilio TaxID=41210 RepID=A0A8J4YML7_CHIOP|nr:hypothetical protein GWK47_038026 [Chionoecetes opilio]